MDQKIGVVFQCSDLDHFRHAEGRRRPISLPSRPETLQSRPIMTIIKRLPSAGEATAQPRIWILAGPRAGDRSQLLALADSLGWPYELKDLAYNRLHHLPNWLLGTSVASLDQGRASALAAPWPDIIIDGGKRSVPIARWVQARSCGQARWVHVGRSWAPMALIDLLVVAPQY